MKVAPPTVRYVVESVQLVQFLVRIHTVLVSCVQHFRSEHYIQVCEQPGILVLRHKHLIEDEPEDFVFTYTGWSDYVRMIFLVLCLNMAQK